MKAKRPAVYMQPDWKGIDADTTGQAQQVAGRDYVVLMADMFGKGYGDKLEEPGADFAPACSPCTRTGRLRWPAARKPSTRLRDEARLKLGLIEPAKSVAIGYCAGGGYASSRLVPARRSRRSWCSTSPIPIRSSPTRRCNIKGRVLAIHGRADPVTPKPMMDALEDELAKAKVDWHIVTFGRGVHSFCDPTANNPAATQYDENLCRTSYMLMRDFFAETL